MHKRLTPAQLKAIDHPRPILQIMAGAGSGKTEVLARRAVRLLTSGADPASIIAFTFTEKAAGELKGRIEMRAAEADPQFRDLPPVGRGMFIGTTHGWALQNLRDLGGIYETLDGLDDEQEWALLLRVARRLGVVDLYAASGGTESHKVAVAPAIEVSLFLSAPPSSSIFRGLFFKYAGLPEEAKPRPSIVQHQSNLRNQRRARILAKKPAALRKSWARLIKRVYQAEPLKCDLGAHCA